MNRHEADRKPIGSRYEEVLIRWNKDTNDVVCDSCFGWPSDDRRIAFGYPSNNFFDPTYAVRWIGTKLMGNWYEAYEETPTRSRVPSHCNARLLRCVVTHPALDMTFCSQNIINIGYTLLLPADTTPAVTYVSCVKWWCLYRCVALRVNATLISLWFVINDVYSSLFSLLSALFSLLLGTLTMTRHPHCHWESAVKVYTTSGGRERGWMNSDDPDERFTW